MLSYIMDALYITAIIGIGVNMLLNKGVINRET